MKSFYSLLVFLSLIFGQRLSAVSISRRNWILEQLSTPVGQSSIDRAPSTFRGALNVTNYSDSLSGMLGLLGDLGPLEIAAYASERFYGGFTDEGRNYKAASNQDSDSIAAELARAFMTREGNFGRASAQYIYFPKNKTAFLRLGVNMGIFEMPDSPWILRLNTHIYFVAQGDENKTYSTLVEVGQTIVEIPNARWRLGLLFGWTYKTRNELDEELNPMGKRVRNEHMLFSIGPWLEYATRYYNVHLGIPWRVWLDKESYKSLNAKNDEERVVFYPTDTGFPDVQVSLSLFL